MAAVFEKELLYLSRSGPMLFTLIVPLFMLAVFRSSGQNEGLFSYAPMLTFPLGAAYSLLLLTNLSYNNCGADGGGVQFFFASPARFRQIMLGKTWHICPFLCYGSCAGMDGNLSALPAAILGRDPGHAGGHSVCPARSTWPRGNLFSLYSPSRVEAGVFGRQRASLTTVLASFAIRGALFGTSAVMFWLSSGSGNSWMDLPIFLLPAGLAFAVYVFTLDRVDSIALDHRENLISNLGRRE